LAVTGRQRKDVIVKIADTDRGADAIRQESQALQAIATSDISGQTPKLIAEGRWYDYYIQLQEKAVGVSHKQTASLTDAHFNFLSKLSTIGRKVTPLKETRVWRDVEAMAKASCSKALSHPIRIALERVLSDKFANMPVVCHRTHGDFTPWNIKVNNGILFVYDWEDSLSDGLALTDIFHFLYRQASLVGPWPGAGKILQDMNEAAKRLSRKTNYDIVDYKVILLLWLLGEYLTNPNDYIVEMVCCLGFEHQ
jgi:Ser/Thr protein kinase RdoA (MazF antagonist)